MNTRFFSSIVTRAGTAATTLGGNSVALILILLLVGGLIVSGIRREGNDAMHRAAENGNLEALRELISRGADPDALDCLNYTPLAWAALRGQINAVELLLENGASVHVSHPQLGTPLMLALANGHADVARVLLERGADVKVVCEGWDPLGSAVRSNDLECLELIHAAGADPHWVGRRCGLLTLASINGDDTRLLRRLLREGVDPNVPDTDGTTPLNNAIECGATEAARLLLLAGADPARAGADGQTPYAAAQRRGCQELLALLTSDDAQAAYSSSTTR